MNRSTRPSVSRGKSRRVLRSRLRQWWGRKSPRVFWAVEADAVVAAVIEPSLGEALLLRCGAIEGVGVIGPPLVAVGVGEMAWALDCAGFVQIAALGRSFCRPVSGSETPGWSAAFPVEHPTEALDGNAPSGLASGQDVLGEDVAVVPIEWSHAVHSAEPGDGSNPVTEGVQVARSVVLATVTAFSQAGLELVELDSGVCALRGLEHSLGEDGHDDSGRDASPLDPLAALNVAAQAEDAAMRLGERLAIPVGLAMSRLEPDGCWRAY